LKFEIRNEGVPGHNNSPNFYWKKIKSPRSFSKKNHSKILCGLVAVKRTNQQFLNLPRILWLGSKVLKSYKNILN